MADENQPSLIPGNPPEQNQETTPPQEPAPSSEAAPPAEEPIVLSKLYPDAKLDLDSLFPDPQMKELLKEVQRTRQGNQRFLKRLNLSKLPTGEDEPEPDP